MLIIWEISACEPNTALVTCIQLTQVAIANCLVKSVVHISIGANKDTSNLLDQMGKQLATISIQALNGYREFLESHFAI